MATFERNSAAAAAAKRYAGRGSGTSAFDPDCDIDDFAGTSPAHPQSRRRQAAPAPHRPRIGVSGSSLIIGATTLAGVGVGLLAVSGGALVLGAVTEAVLIPSLLLKLAGGLAGGGLGMALGLKDARPRN
jgi:hypothetical protein